MNLSNTIQHFRDQRVLVVGDLILDHYIRGSVSRTSPEAPVPVLHVTAEEWLPGGAANVAVNVTALGAKAELMGVVGNDESGARLKELLKSYAGLTPRLLVEKGRATTLKSRCVAQGQQMLRFDREVNEPISDATMSAALERIEKRLPHCSGVILSDYGKGFLRPEFLKKLITMVKDHGLRVVVDPKGRDYGRYRGVSVLTPNQKEASEASGIAIKGMESLTAAARALQKTVQGEAVVITRGEAGISVFPRRGKASHVPARAREVFDVTGAGDTVISTLGLALFSGADFHEAAALGNLAAGIVVGRAGVASVSANSLIVACQEEDDQDRRKLVSMAELEQVCRSLRQNGRRIVFTNGFFDLLHHGHVRLLSEARRMGDCLIVAINSDASTRRLKGDPRPILKCGERLDLLAALPYVDYVTIFEEDTPEGLLRRLRPDILVKGGNPDSRKTDVVGWEYVESYGGEVRLVHFANEPRISSILERAGRESKSRSRKKS